MEYIKNNYKTILFTIIYAIITFLCVIHHEIWADEAQVWLIAKNVSFLGLFKHLVNEGHPSLFYLLMMPFAKLGLPIFFMQVFCWLAMIGSVFLLLKYSPFNGFTKFAIITSAGFLYFFPVIARSYSILPLLVFCLAILYPKQKEHPIWYAILVAITANVHAIMVGFAGILMLFFVWDNCLKNRKNFNFSLQKKYIYSALIMLVGLLAVYLQLRGTTSSNIFINISFSNLLYSIISVFSKFLIIGIDSTYSESLTLPAVNNFQLLLMLFSAFLYIWIFAWILKSNKKIFAITFLSILFQFAIYILAYNKCVQATRVYSASLIILFALWCIFEQQKINKKTHKILNVSIIIFLLLSTLNGIRYTLADIIQPYSGSKQTAKYILKNLDKDAFLMTDNAPYCISLIQYLGNNRKIYSIHDMKSINYIVWNENMYKFVRSNDYDTYIQHMKQENEKFESKKIYVVLSSFHKHFLKIKDLKNFELIYESKPGMLKFENYSIYRYLGNN